MKLKNKIIMLIGAPASGKSTAAENISRRENNAVILSTDKIRAALYGDESIQGNWSDIEAILYKDIKNTIKANKNIILDGGQLVFTSKENISNAISLTTDIGSNETIELGFLSERYF